VAVAVAVAAEERAVLGWAAVVVPIVEGSAKVVLMGRVVRAQEWTGWAARGWAAGGWAELGWAAVGWAREG